MASNIPDDATMQDFRRMSNAAMPKINQWDEEGLTSIHRAAGSGDCDLILQLIKQGAEPDAFGGWDRTPLHEAAEAGQAAAVTLLLKHGANVNAGDKDGYSVLHYAVGKGHYDVAKQLIAARADVTKGDQYARTPLHEAATRNHAAVVELLLEHGASANAQDRDLQTPIICAAKAGKVEEAYEMVDEGPLSCCVATKKRLLEEASRRQQATLEILLKKGANVQMQDKAGQTALHVASALGLAAFALKLIKSRAPINMSDKEGKTPLHVAALFECTAVVELLLKHGANANARCKEGMNALHYNVQAGTVSLGFETVNRGPAKHAASHPAMSVHSTSHATLATAELLLRHGTNPAAKDVYWKTPSACARRSVKMALAARLERAMPGPSQEPPKQPNGVRPKLAKKKKQEARG